MKKLAFVACLMIPLGLVLYSKVPGWMEAYAAKQVIRQIPLGKSQLEDAFKKLRQAPQVPRVVKTIPVKPKATIPLPKPRPQSADALILAPIEQQPVEFCAFSWLSSHCGRND